MKKARYYSYLCGKTIGKMNERLILVTNDDGYDSKGMEAAIEVARAFGRVVVVAPETTQSGMSQAITMYNPLYLRRIREEEGVAVYAFSGTPVDCVKMAFDYLLRDERVDMVISGVNHGSNSAVNVLYSGTMGAAIEGSFYGRLSGCRSTTTGPTPISPLRWSTAGGSSATSSPRRSNCRCA